MVTGSMKKSNLKLLRFSIYSLYTLLLLTLGYKVFVLFNNTYYQYLVGVMLGSLFFLLLKAPRMIVSILLKNYTPVKKHTGKVRRGA